VIVIAIRKNKPIRKRLRYARPNPSSFRELIIDRIQTRAYSTMKRIDLIITFLSAFIVSQFFWNAGRKLNEGNSPPNQMKKLCDTDISIGNNRTVLTTKF
jgi:hypothetical protein